MTSNPENAVGAGTNVKPRLPALGRTVRVYRSRIALASVILLLIAITATQSSVFLTVHNFVNVASQVAVLGVLASGTTLLMVSRGMDLSIGSSLSLSGMVLAFVMLQGAPIWLAIVACLAVAAAVGAVNGTLASYSPIHPFVITLGVLTLLQGLALLVSQTPLYGLPNEFITWGRLKFLGLPIAVVVFALVALFCHILLRATKLGRWLYAIGGSESAAHLAGVRIRTVKIGIYTLNGLLVGIGSILLVSQIGSAGATMGAGQELSAIAAVAVGGTTLAGGKGDMIGTLLGVLLLGLISNALNLMSISPNWQYVLQGLVIVTAVMAQRDAK
ncbi:ABC transporter permease [Mesorhizobium newzealandense]|uniref:ABC transporter permease n=2 Tax=Mesorhizobium TaxID=68287 RepID=A0ABW4U806_9HYPH